MAIPGDVNILFSLLNTKLRDSGESLTDILLQLDPDADCEQILHKLNQAGYAYQAEQRRFCRQSNTKEN